jgi:hypothetical protein
MARRACRAVCGVAARLPALSTGLVRDQLRVITAQARRAPELPVGCVV